MNSGPPPASPWRGPVAPSAPSSSPAWRSQASSVPYRPRWRRLALVALLGLAALAAVTWVVFWMRPPEPARVVILHAGYDRTLAVPPNPYGKHDSRELATLARPGSWFGTRSKLAGGPTTTLSRGGLPDLSAVREKCIVVFIAAHGGRDRDGPFLFPEDSTHEPADRVRFKTLLDQLAKLPASKQKLLIVDATREPAFTELGLVHNDFAGGVEELEAEIASVPNLAVWLSSGLDERSWTSPEWGTSVFTHFVMTGLNGAADIDGNRRMTVGEIVSYVAPRVFDWVRDNRGARQVPVLLPKSDGENRIAAMHLVSVDSMPAGTAPEPFEPPPELKSQWEEYCELAKATPPPTAYTPHLWRQYEAWVLRHEQHILANDTDGAKIARANAAEVRRKIEAARTLDISPQTLAIQSAVGGREYKLAVPNTYKLGIESLPRAEPAKRSQVWAKLRTANGDTETSRSLWCRALIEWVAADPVDRLPVARELIPLIGDSFALRPAELNFLAMLARHLPLSAKKDDIGPLLTRILLNRLKAEQAAAFLEPDKVDRATQPPDPNAPVPIASYPYAEFLHAWLEADLEKADRWRRETEDLCFSTDKESWNHAIELSGSADSLDALRDSVAWSLRDLHAAWHRDAHQLPALGEWYARRPGDPVKWGARDGGFLLRQMMWQYAHDAGDVSQRIPERNSAWLNERLQSRDNIAFLNGIDSDYDKDFAALLEPRAAAVPTARKDMVQWWNTADAVLTAAPPNASFDPTARVTLAREFRRVSRQLLITNETRPEQLPEVTPAKAREVAFEIASRRAVWLLGRFGGSEHFASLNEVQPGEDWHKLDERLKWFAFQADGRQSLAAFGSRCGELFDAAATLAKKPGGALAADRWVRISPAHAPISDEPIDHVRRERVRNYLAFQARRTFADHWYDENGRYYNLAIQRLKTDAATLVAAFPQPPKPTDDPFKLLLAEEPLFPVVPKLPARITVTDEPKPEVRFGFIANTIPNVAGYPVFWIDPKSREPIRTTPDDAAFTRNLTRPAVPNPLTPKAQTESLPVSGFFRGRSYSASTPVDFYFVPDRAAVSTPLPQTVGLAVRADAKALARYGYGTGAVAILLDCSGSMGRDPKDSMNTGLYPKVVAALEKLLKELPRGTTVTVWTFGQKTYGVKTAEETIRELLSPTELPLASGTYDDLLAQIRGQEPWHESPVVRAAITAKNRIKDAKVPFRAVVLLSDGVDNRFAVDPDFGEKKRTIGDVLRAEFPPEVAFGVVAFPVGKEEQAVQGEFKLVEKLIPAGKFVPPDQVNDLIDWLRTGLNQRVRFTLKALNSDTLPMSLMAGTGETDNWYADKLSPGQYRLRVDGASLESEITLLPGDRLLLDLIENEEKPSLKRHWFADRVPAVAKAGEPEGEWRMSLLQNWSKSNPLELFSTIDSNPNIVNRFTPTRIGDVWFDVTPQIPDPGPAAIRWRAESGFPAPCWSLGSPGWPQFPGSAAPASPRLSAWWSPEPFAAAPELLKLDSNAFTARDHRMTVAGASIVVDSVTLEEHEVEVSPGEFQKRMCLVIRVTHASGEPVFVRPSGEAPTGREVRVYKSANKTTSLYWWPKLDADSVKARVTALEFVPLNESLRAAEKGGRHLTLPAPAPTDTSAKPGPPTK